MSTMTPRDYEQTGPENFTGEARDRLFEGRRRQLDALAHGEDSTDEPARREGVDAPPRTPAGEPTTDDDANPDPPLDPAAPPADPTTPTNPDGTPAPDVGDAGRRKGGEGDAA